MNILRKSIISLIVLSCLVLSACGNETQTSEETTTTTTQEAQETTQTEETQEITQVEEAQETTQVEETQEVTEEIETIDHLTASDVLEKLKATNSNVGNYIEYTEETDTNNLLGRPNQYISKINGADTRIEQTDENSPEGFSIEVFENNEDALARQEYINQIGEQMPMMVEYNYVNDYILIRVNKDLTPTQAKEYEDFINNIF